MNAFSSSQYTPVLPFPSTSLGQKRWQTNVQIEILLHQWGDVACTQWAEGFFLVGRGGLEFFSIFLLLFSSSFEMIPQVANVFHKMLPLAPHCYPIRCGQICLLLTYIGKPKGEALHLQIKTSILGASKKIFALCDGPIKMTHCTQNRKESSTWKHLHLISWNMNTRVLYSCLWHDTHGFQIALCVSFLQFPLE